MQPNTNATECFRFVVYCIRILYSIRFALIQHPVALYHNRMQYYHNWMQYYHNRMQTNVITRDRQIDPYQVWEVEGGSKAHRSHCNVLLSAP